MYFPLVIKDVIICDSVSLLMLVPDFNSANRQLLSEVIMRVVVIINK